MELTFMNDMGQTYIIGIDPTMELEIAMALLEAESGIPANEQNISYEGRDLSSHPKSTLAELGVVGEQVTMFVRRKGTVAGREVEQDSETMRLQVLGNPELLRQIQSAHPELATAAQSDPAEFARLLRQTQAKQAELRQAEQREVERLEANPFDEAAQRRIEEIIREQGVTANLEHALEYSPEIFGRVTMLYIDTEVNGRPVKAFVDSGAQSTIMSPECAEACGIMRLVDRRMAGIARGVGTAKIIGRVHSAQLKLADLHLACSFTILEGRSVDFLFGLDMLKAYQANIDLEKNVLRIQGREIPFLSDHELPPEAREEPSSADLAADHNAGSSSSASPFPGGGNTLGAPPSQIPPPHLTPTVPRPPLEAYPENDIRTLMDLGLTREQAASTLEAAGGNVDIAASMLF